MREGIVRTQILWQDRPIRIGAQYRLEEFYQELGFESHGAVYIEDAIEHIEMVLAGNTPLHGYPREHST
jgi:ElaA protein